ncbi:SAM-dependent methyltransferase [Niveibacterium sp. 24ML]|uniref:methyltransferase n=1 Tax=Niveibacterium sp. 24ML TaxID=2985512 RepID=UPI0022719860|nr:methyltransferase [Niveibacterium sp. 24ML]MCX9156439.1 SAM-dependent methyltransferase [Niveibacterium sp. 24ML]
MRERRVALEAALLAGEIFWREMPFRVSRPGWVDRYPEIDAELMAMSSEGLAALLDNNLALVTWLTQRAGLSALFAGLIAVPRVSHAAADAGDPRQVWGIPGRKLQQIEAFLSSAGELTGDALEWCAGKGHLGRLHQLRTHAPVVSLEIDETLCRQGQALAARAGATAHRFVCGDALAPDAGLLLKGRHALALHACGDLHRRLAEHAAARGSLGVDIAPCCYYRLSTPEYSPFSRASRLRLTRDDLHLAVTETVTAPAREIRGRDRETSWKLAFVAWRERSLGEPYRSFKPVPEAWMRRDLADFLARMCEREGISPPPEAAVPALEREALHRLNVMMRRSAVRLAFRRVMELWLVCDLAEPLLGAGFEVGIREFCDRRLTPRNLLLSARRPS